MSLKHEIRVYILCALSAFAVWSVATTHAYAAFEPTFKVNLSGDNGGPVLADSVPVFETVITKDPAERSEMRKVKVAFPNGWKVNNVDNGQITKCQRPADVGENDFRAWFETQRRDANGNIIPGETHNNCPDSSMIGTVSADVKLGGGIFHGEGHVYLLDSDPYEDPVKLGVFINVDAHQVLGVNIAKSVFGNITLEGRFLAENIVADFDLLEIDITSIDLKLTNEAGRGLIRTPVGCGQKQFTAEITSNDNPPTVYPGESNTAIGKDCDLSNPGVPRTFNPKLKITSENGAIKAGGAPDLSIGISGDINNGAARHQSVHDLTLRLPKGMVGSIFPFDGGTRCPSDMVATDWMRNPDTCKKYRIGEVKATILAAQDKHDVAGDVYIADPPQGSRDLARLKIVLKNLPKRINFDDDFDRKDTVVIESRLRLNSENQRVEAVVEELPTTYEIRNIDIYLKGSPERSVRPMLINPTHCDPNNSFAGRFVSDRGLQKLVSDEPTRYVVSGCDLLGEFAPLFRHRFFSQVPGTATAALFEIEQNHRELRQAYVKTAKMLLAKGLKANSQIDDITPCDRDDVGECDGSSRIGSVIATSSILEGKPGTDSKLQGNLHMMKTQPGKQIKLAVKLEHRQLDISITQEAYVKVVNDNGDFRIQINQSQPNLPVDNLKIVVLKKLLQNPWKCGPDDELSSQVDFTSHNGESSTSTSSAALSPCAGDPHNYRPSLDFEPTTSQAGKPTDLKVKLTRPSADQNTRKVAMTLPTGWGSDVLTKPICSDEDAQRSACDQSSQIGSVKVTANIFKFLDPLVIDGKLFNCKRSGNDVGAICVDVPLPEIAGGGNLRLKGRILVEENARKIKVVIDDLPTEFDIQVEMDITGSTTPTICSENPAAADFTGELGTDASVADPYSSINCDNLNFGPRLDVRHTSTKANETTGTTTTITNASGDATMETVHLKFPVGTQVDLKKLSVGCSPQQKQDRNCPPKSRMGSVVAESPYLPHALEGGVYLGNGGTVYVLIDGLVSLDFEGKIDTGGQGAQLGFKLEGLPPLAVTRTVVKLDSGIIKNPKKCDNAQYSASFRSHSGKSSTASSSVSVCGGEGQEPEISLRAKLKPARQKSSTDVLFTVQHKDKQVNHPIKNLTVKLGKSKKSSLGFSRKNLMRRAISRSVRKRGASFGRLTLTPTKGKSFKFLFLAKKTGMLRVSANSAQKRKYIKAVSKVKRRYEKARGKNRKSLQKKLAEAKRNLSAYMRFDKQITKRTKGKLQSRKLTITRIPRSIRISDKTLKFKRIIIRLAGRRGGVLKNPNAKKITFSALVKPFKGEPMKAKSTVILSKAKNDQRLKHMR